jgi:hypothetical protein
LKQREGIWYSNSAMLLEDASIIYAASGKDDLANYVSFRASATIAAATQFILSSVLP